MKNILTLALRLLAITVVAGLLLGVTYAMTKGPIAEQQRLESDMARRTVLPEAAEFETVDMAGLDMSGYENIKEAAKGYRDGTLVGVAVLMEAKGFNPGISLTVGIGTDGTLKGIRIGEHQETPGLGAKASEPVFTDRFADIPYDSPLTVVKTAKEADNEIEAISGATIS